jgi:hypothetical protein
MITLSENPLVSWAYTARGYDEMQQQSTALLLFVLSIWDYGNPSPSGEKS